MKKTTKIKTVQLLCGTLIYLNATGISARADEPTNLFKRLPTLTANETRQSDVITSLMQAGRYDLSIKILQNDKTLYRKQRLFIQLLTCYFLLRSFDELISQGQLWIEANQDTSAEMKSLIFEFIATGLYMQGKFLEACEWFDKSIAINSNEMALKGKAESLSKLREKEGGAAVSSEPVPIATSIQLQIGTDLAIAPTIELQPIQPNQNGFKTTILLKNAEKLELEGKFEDAFLVYRELAQTQTCFPLYLGAQALCALTCKKDSMEVNDLFEKSIKGGMPDWRLINNVAVFKFLNNDNQKASELFSQVLPCSEVPENQRTQILAAMRIIRNLDKLRRYRSTHISPSNGVSN